MLFHIGGNVAARYRRQDTSELIYKPSACVIVSFQISYLAEVLATVECIWMLACMLSQLS